VKPTGMKWETRQTRLVFLVVSVSFLNVCSFLFVCVCWPLIWLLFHFVFLTTSRDYCALDQATPSIRNPSIFIVFSLSLVSVSFFFPRPPSVSVHEIIIHGEHLKTSIVPSLRYQRRSLSLSPLSVLTRARPTEVNVQLVTLGTKATLPLEVA
jgi:hypothetical protein